MHWTRWSWAWIALLVGSSPALAQTTPTVEIPIGKSGEVQVRRSSAGWPRRADIVLDRPTADLTLVDAGARSFAHARRCWPRRSAPKSRSPIGPARWS